MSTETAKHTPGPWRVEDWQYPQTGREHVSVIQNDKDAVAEVLDLWSMDFRAEEKAANARLIAAAPELLESLRLMVDMFERHIDGRPGPDDAATRWDSARAAIAKAEGR